METGGFQQQVLRAYTALWLLRPQWSGSLILSCGLNEQSAAFALGANIAGAVCLSMEPNPELLKSAVRIGACDFGVNTLDEALRTMKNEVRKGTPLGVGLQGDIATTLAEVLERGLLPVAATDLRESSADPLRAAMQQLEEIGTQILAFGGRKVTDGSVDAEALIQEWERRQVRTLCCIGAKSQSDLLALDAALRDLVTPEDRLRARWLERAPPHFLRKQPLYRAIWLSESEATELRSAGREVAD